MKAILVLQHQTQDTPAGFVQWLRLEGLQADVRNQEAGDPYPSDTEGHAGLALMGGEMSANDDLPALRQGEALILDAMARGVPVLGHCLGGQLMARALGARVGPSPAPEIGWQPMTIADDDEARAWFGGSNPVTVFHWHYEGFSLPPGARALARSPACPVQAFSIGRHLAMQFHVELDAEKLGRWSRSVDPDFQARVVAGEPTVQSGDAMRRDAAWALPAQTALAHRLYRRWLHLD